MHNLQTLQNTMCAAILGGDMTHIAEDLVAGAANPARRMKIFRNNTFASLTECLRTVFPATVRLAGADFFAYAAHQFIAKHPPRAARLSRYGAEFPRFLAAFPPCREFPVIAEMARLEWAVAESLNEPEEDPVPLSLVSEAGLSEGKACLSLQPNLRFAISHWPLIGLWSNRHRSGGDTEGPVRRQVSRFAVARYGDGIQVIALDAARFAFWRDLIRGHSLGGAARRALVRCPLFDLAGETVTLFRTRLVTGIFNPITKGQRT